VYDRLAGLLLRADGLYLAVLTGPARALTATTRNFACRECWHFSPSSRCVCSQRCRPPLRDDVRQENSFVATAACLRGPCAATTAGGARRDMSAVGRGRASAGAVSAIHGYARTGTYALWARDALTAGVIGAVTTGHATTATTAIRARSAKETGAIAHGRTGERRIPLRHLVPRPIWRATGG